MFYKILNTSYPRLLICNYLKDATVDKAKSRKEIANELGISTKTLKRWFIKNDLTIPNGLISPKMVGQIKGKFYTSE